MVQIKAFKGVRPAKELAAKVASKPYDVLTTEEARAEANGNEHTFLHVVKSAIDFPPGYDEYAQEVYDKARDNFYGLMEKNTLLQDAQPYLYVYAQKMGDHRQVGLVAASSVQDYFDDKIKKHEFTRPKKEQDRINHMKTTGTHPGPVFLTYPDVSEIDAIINEIQQGEPENDFTADDGVQHTLWVVKDPGQIQQLVSLFAAKVEASYIADGHHRAASSAKVGQQMKEENPAHNGSEDYNNFLSVLFPASQLKIIDYNRLVQDLNGLSEEDFLAKVAEKFRVIRKGEAIYKPVQFKEFSMYLNGSWYQLIAKEGTYIADDPVKGLDVSILQDNLLGPLLGIDDPRTSERIDFVGGIRGLGELQKRVDSGEIQVAFALYPVSIQQLMDIADSGEVMPPKSTWFEPKLRSGLVVHKFA